MKESVHYAELRWVIASLCAPFERIYAHYVLRGAHWNLLSTWSLYLSNGCGGAFAAASLDAYVCILCTQFGFIVNSEESSMTLPLILLLFILNANEYKIKWGEKRAKKHIIKERIRTNNRMGSVVNMLNAAHTHDLDPLVIYWIDCEWPHIASAKSMEHSLSPLRDVRSCACACSKTIEIPVIPFLWYPFQLYESNAHFEQFHLYNGKITKKVWSRTREGVKQRNSQYCLIAIKQFQMEIEHSQ